MGDAFQKLRYNLLEYKSEVSSEDFYSRYYVGFDPASGPSNVVVFDHLSLPERRTNFSLSDTKFAELCSSMYFKGDEFIPKEYEINVKYKLG